MSAAPDWLYNATETERRYTLDEAECELTLRECRTRGHDWAVGPRAMCEVYPSFVVCARCGETAPVVPPKAP